MLSRKGRIVKFIAVHNLRMDRGNSLKAKITHPIEKLIYMVVGGGIGMDLWVRYQELRFPLMVALISLGIIMADKITDDLVGWFDEKKGFWKAESVYQAKNINPFLREMSDNIKEIKEKLNK